MARRSCHGSRALLVRPDQGSGGVVMLEKTARTEDTVQFAVVPPQVHVSCAESEGIFDVVS